jgi:KipI family sensor histidine kinase inhibitor
LTADQGSALRIRPVGDTALTAELGDAVDPVLNARVRALDRALLARPFHGFVESVPTHRSLLVCFDPARIAFAEARLALSAMESEATGNEGSSALHEIPVRYGDEDGPDLEAVARRAGLTASEVVDLHAGREYTAFMLGFLPGFAYLGLLPEVLDTPRLETPRVRVPTGSVGLAGRLTGVYPAAVPGGWSLIGRAAPRLFDPGADPPTLIAPGDRVRFVAVDRLDETKASPRVLAPRSALDPSAEVIASGLLTTLQDGGRTGFRRYGVGGSGPLDAQAHALANHAVGNPPAATTLECTLVGPTLRFLRPTAFAVTGADLGARLERDDLGSWPVPRGIRVVARAGNVLSFEGRRSGCRAYIAFAGGLDADSVMGSRATDLMGGFGGLEGRALASGDVLVLLPSGRGSEGLPQNEAPAQESDGDDDASVRVMLGPQDDHFTAEAVEAFLSATWSVRGSSDRSGLRLEGPRLAHRGASEIASDGMVPGCVQVPPDGQPIVILADGPTTGGYPKIATVLRADLRKLGQLVPGVGRVRFDLIKARP